MIELINSKRKQRNRRYYLHKRVRMFAKLNTRMKTIYIPYLFEPTEKQSQYFDDLRALGYAVQTELDY